MSKRMNLIQKFVVLIKKEVIATQNTSGSLYSILMYHIKFPLPSLGYYIFKNFPTPPHLLRF